jgi:SAM-dependent methyltransferase
VHALDLDPRYVERVLARIGGPRLSGSACPFEEFVPEKLPEARDGAFDSIVSTNVLEHIADDTAAARSFARLLAPGGRALVLVPAHRWLYSALDRRLSHHRRYRRRDLEALARSSGLALVRSRHFNPLGALGWWLNGKVLRRATLPATQLRLYSRFAVPLSALLDALNPFPLGVSLLAVFEKR